MRAFTERRRLGGPVVLLVLVGLTTCGGESSTGPTCWTYPPYGVLRCCPVVWTADVPAGGNVLLNPLEGEQSKCTFTVETACVVGPCAGLRVRIASHDLAVPSLNHLSGDISEIRATSGSQSPARVTVAISGECTDCLP
jgi:hypothetical protein